MAETALVSAQTPSGSAALSTSPLLAPLRPSPSRIRQRVHKQTVSRTIVLRLSYTLDAPPARRPCVGVNANGSFTPTPAVRFASTVALALRLKGRGRVRSRARCQRYLPDLKCRLQTVRAASLATYSIASSLDILASDRRRFRIHSCVSAPKRDPLLEWSANH